MKQKRFPFEEIDRQAAKEAATGEFSEQTLQDLDPIRSTTTWHLHRNFSAPIDKDFQRLRRKMNKPKKS